MRGRVTQLEDLRAPLLAGDAAALAAARSVGHALSGSGGSFGFPEISAAGALLEDAPEWAAARRAEGMVALLRRLAWPDDASQHRDFAWLACAAGVEPGPVSDPHEAWQTIADAAGMTQEALAERAGAVFGLAPAPTLVPSRQALRLVPEALIREAGILPLAEDGVRIQVASSNPTVLAVIDQLHRLTGRLPDFVVVPPAALAAAVAPIVAEPRGERPGARPPTVAATGRPTILLVDDDPLARVIAKSVLEKKEYAVVEASDGERALDTLAEHPEVLLAVVDLEMPGMGGRALVRAIRAAPDTAHIPLVVLTGSEDPVLEADLIEDGADDYIRKPLDPRLFLARVASTLRRVRS